MHNWHGRSASFHHRRLRYGGVAIAVALAFATRWTPSWAWLGLPDVDQLEQAAETARQQHAEEVAQRCETGSAEKRSTARAAALQHLPASCNVLAYVDVYTLRQSRGLHDAEPRLAERAHQLGERYPALAEITARWVHALSDHGVDLAHDIDEIAACVTGDQRLAVTVAGNVEGVDLVGIAAQATMTDPADVAAATPANADYVRIERLLAAKVASGVVALAADEHTLDETRGTHGGLEEREGSDDDVGLLAVSAFRGKQATLTLAPEGDALVLTSNLHQLEGDFSSSADRPLLQSRIEAIVDALTRSPLSAAATDVARSNMTLDGSTIKVRTVLPYGVLYRSVREGSEADLGQWSTLAAIIRDATRR